MARADQNNGQGRGRGAPGQGEGGAQIGGPQGTIMIGKVLVVPML